MRYHEAIEVFKKAIQIDQDHAESYNNLGCAYVELLRYKEAIKVCKQAVNINPKLAEPYYNLGVAYFMIGDRGSALEEYKTLKGIDKDMANKLRKFLNKDKELSKKLCEIKR